MDRKISTAGYLKASCNQQQRNYKSIESAVKETAIFLLTNTNVKTGSEWILF